MLFRSHLLQDLVYACLSDTDFQQSLEQTRQFYAGQQQKMAQALRAQGITHIAPGDGLNFWLPLTDSSQDMAFTLAKSGWLVREGDAFGVQSPAQGLRITLSTLNDNDINRLAGDIRQALSR